MTTRKNLVTTIHDAIDTVATTVEDVHKQVADVPLEVLGEITSLTDTLDEVRAMQARSIAAVYGLVRAVNGGVRRLTTGIARR
jgi:hypothetical protein